LLSHLC